MCKYLPDFSLYLMLIIRTYVVLVCINSVMALYGYLAPLVYNSFASAKPCSLYFVVFGLLAKTGYLCSIIHSAVLSVSCSFIAV